jgi:hypothetical protein
MEKRVKAYLSNMGSLVEHGMEWKPIKYERGHNIPDEFEIVYQEPEPHQCAGLKRQRRRIVYDSGKWVMERPIRKIEYSKSGWATEHEVEHGCSCCDWAIPVKQAEGRSLHQCAEALRFGIEIVRGRYSWTMWKDGGFICVVKRCPCCNWRAEADE